MEKEEKVLGMMIAEREWTVREYSIGNDACLVDRSFLGSLEREEGGLTLSWTAIVLTILEVDSSHSSH